MQNAWTHRGWGWWWWWWWSWWAAVARTADLHPRSCVRFCWDCFLPERWSKLWSSVCVYSHTHTLQQPVSLSVLMKQTRRSWQVGFVTLSCPVLHPWCVIAADWLLPLADLKLTACWEYFQDMSSEPAWTVSYYVKICFVILSSRPKNQIESLILDQISNQNLKERKVWVKTDAFKCQLISYMQLIQWCFAAESCVTCGEA